jgi:glycogenin glucosyltransferase
MKQTFVTYLGTDSFLPGVLVLEYSFRSVSNKSPFLILVSERVSQWSFELLNDLGYKFKMVKEIANPNPIRKGDREFQSVYGKLNVFNLVDYEKVVYLDADMVVCENLDELFQWPHMSAVAAGSIVPRNRSWKDLNSGLMVIQPDKDLFEDMLSKIDVLPSSTKGDQGFLHSFYPKWSSCKELHLDHKYNVPVQYLDDYISMGYCQFEFENTQPTVANIAILHYWGPIKPWLSGTMSNGMSRKASVAFHWWRTLYDRLPLSENIKNEIREW